MSGTSLHLPLLNGTLTEMGELIMGTEGAVHITVGDDRNPGIMMWNFEAAQVSDREIGLRKRRNTESGRDDGVGRGREVAADFDVEGSDQ